MSVITRLGAAPGLRRLVQKPPAPPGAVREHGDGDPGELLCCMACRRDLLPGVLRCGDCGATGVTHEVRARRAGQLAVTDNPILSTRALGG